MTAHWSVPFLLCAMVLHPSGIEAKLLNTGGSQLDNTLSGHSQGRVSSSRARDWVKLSAEPPLVVKARLGERVDMECEVLGSPSPEIQWTRGSQVVQQTQRPNANAHLNAQPGAFHDKAGLAKLRSRLVIDCVEPQHEGFYSCVARAGTETVRTPASLLLIAGGSPDGCKSHDEGHKPQPPRITSWNPTAMENMGVDILLPCQAVGTPTPSVYWLDQEDNVLDNFRYQVLDNGDLAISSLSWSDMGQYTCIAENSEGRDAVTSFVYPLLNDRK